MVFIIAYLYSLGFRFCPIVLEQTLKKRELQLLEPIFRLLLLHHRDTFLVLYDAQKHCAIIETSQSKNDEIILQDFFLYVVLMNIVIL